MTCTQLALEMSAADALGNQVGKFPSTRYMGSKHKLVPFLTDAFGELSFETALDAFSGSGVVAYLLKTLGKTVCANDHLHFCFHNANATVANSSVVLDAEDMKALLRYNRRAKRFIQTTFDGLYFTASENRFLDNLVANIRELESPEKRSLAFAAACRACMRRRPRGVFTYTGHRYDDGRKDLRTELPAHFCDAVEVINAAVFSNGKDNSAVCSDIYGVQGHYDLVYIDPPYVSSSSDNDYTRRYHFLEGLVRYWVGIEIQAHTETKKFRPPATPFSSRRTVVDGFGALFDKFADSILVVSYSSTGIPGRDELRDLMLKYKAHVEIVSKPHSYSFGTHGHKIGNATNRVDELLFIGF